MFLMGQPFLPLDPLPLGFASAGDDGKCPLHRVVPGLVPRIHEFSKGGGQVVDARDEPGMTGRA